MVIKLKQIQKFSKIKDELFNIGGGLKIILYFINNTCVKLLLKIVCG